MESLGTRFGMALQHTWRPVNTIQLHDKEGPTIWYKLVDKSLQANPRFLPIFTIRRVQGHSPDSLAATRHSIDLARTCAGRKKAIFDGNMPFPSFPNISNKMGIHCRHKNAQISWIYLNCSFPAAFSLLAFMTSLQTADLSSTGSPQIVKIPSCLASSAVKIQYWRIFWGASSGERQSKAKDDLNPS